MSLNPATPLASESRDSGDRTGKNTSTSQLQSAVLQPETPRAADQQEFTKTRPSGRDTQERIKVRTEISDLVEDHPYSMHFSVERLVDQSNGQNTYAARLIHGFPLDDSAKLDAWCRDKGLNKHDLSNKMDELATAVEWLNGQGYFHNDVGFANIMCDTVNEAMVLVDFEVANRHMLYDSSGEHSLIKNIRDVIVDRLPA